MGGTVPIPQGAQVQDQEPTPAPPTQKATSSPAGAVPIPQGAQVGESEPQQSAEPGFIDKTESGIKEGALDLWGMVKKAAPAAAEKTVTTALSSIGGDLPEEVSGVIDHLKSASAVIDVYEKARQNGSSVKDALLAANDHATKIDAIHQALDERYKEFKKQPTQESARGIVDIAGVLAAIYGTHTVSGLIGAAGAGGEASAVEGAEAAEPAAAAGSPAVPGPFFGFRVPQFVKDIMQGERVAQAPAQSALRTAAGSDEANLSQVMTKTVDAAKSTMRDLYEEAGSAKGKVAQPLVDKIKDIDDRLDKLNGDDALDNSIEADSLERARARLVKQIEDIPGTDKATAAKATTAYKQYRALQNVQNKVMKNPSIVDIDANTGEASVNVDAAINTLRRLQANRYGDQVEAAFGKEGSEQLFKELYRARSMGAHAIKAQAIAKWLAVTMGAGTAVHAASVLTR